MKRIVNAKGVYDIRPADTGDLDYILSSWMRTWEKSPEMDLPGMLRDEYFRNTHLMLDELVARASKKGSMYVCHATGAPHIIRGFLCAEAYTAPDIAYVHWIQVKRPDWNRGVASALLEAFIADFDIQPTQNILYTFGSKALTLRKLAKTACDRYNLVAWPWFKYTSQPYGWEAGS